MALNHPRPYANSVPEYMISGIPWVTESNVSSGVTEFSFPYATRMFTVRNDSANTIYVSFTYSGSIGTNKFQLVSSGSFADELRIRSLFVSASATSRVTIVAGLTSILRGDFPIITGSNGFEGVG